MIRGDKSGGPSTGVDRPVDLGLATASPALRWEYVWLDPTFGNNGLVTTSVVPANDWIESLGRLSDGRILAAGRAIDPDFGEPAYARYLGS
jgi:hypothetical protein